MSRIIIPDFIWDECKIMYEVEGVDSGEIAKIFGLRKDSLVAKAASSGWIKNVVLKAAKHNVEILHEIQEKETELNFTHDYVDLVAEKMKLLESRQYQSEVNNIKQTGNMRILIDQLRVFLDSNDVLNDLDSNGVGMADIRAYSRLVAAAKALMVDDKSPQLAVSVNNQISIMDDIAKQNASIYDDIKYDNE